MMNARGVGALIAHYEAELAKAREAADFWKADSVAGWDACWRRRLEVEELRADLTNTRLVVLRLHERVERLENLLAAEGLSLDDT